MRRRLALAGASSTLNEGHARTPKVKMPFSAHSSVLIQRHELNGLSLAAAVHLFI